jgi:soluble lytic murein transglycosylase-like protein
MKLRAYAVLAVLVAAPAQAQVLEIGAGGEVRTYDGPVIFTADGATSLRPKRKVAAAAPDTAALLADAAQQRSLDPALLRAVAVQESGGRMNAVSDKGALGIMQLMPGTAAELGVDPADAADNIRGGALYLRRQLDRFGSVPLALAAYNAGPGAVLRYGGVPPFRETQNYVARILQRWRQQVPSATAPQSKPVQINPTVIEVPDQ